jgi:hypothetical protein
MLGHPSSFFFDVLGACNLGKGHDVWHPQCSDLLDGSDDNTKGTSASCKHLQ